MSNPHTHRRTHLGGRSHTRTAFIGPNRNVTVTSGIRESDAWAVTTVQLTIF